MKSGPKLQSHAMVFQHGPIDINDELSPIPRKKCCLSPFFLNLW